MRIAHMIDNLRVGGAQRLMVTFAEALDHSAHELTVLALGADAHPPTLARLDATATTTEFFDAGRLADMGRARMLTRFVRDNNFDVLATHLFHANVLGAGLRVATGTPVVPVLHNVAAPRGPARAMLWRRAIRHGSDAIVACAHAVRDAHASWLAPDRVTALPNPVALPAPLSPEARARLRAEILGTQRGTLAVSVGTISPQKAFTDLVAAFARIDEATLPVHLAIAGRGAAAAIAEVEDAIAAHGVGHRVVLLGQRDDIGELLQASDIYVSSSHWEGLPVAVLEAMAAGLPVIVTDVGDNRRVVDDSCGALVPPRRPDLLAEAVQRLLADPAGARARGRRAHEIVAEKHDPARWVRDHIAVYADTAARHRKTQRS